LGEEKLALRNKGFTGRDRNIPQGNEVRGKTPNISPFSYFFFFSMNLEIWLVPCSLFVSKIVVMLILATIMNSKNNKS
jgi:hypothetical protein